VGHPERRRQPAHRRVGARRRLAAPGRSTLAAVAGPSAVVAAVLLANVLALTGVVDVNPLGPIGITATAVQRGFLPGQWFTDPNIGWTSQALGRLAATDWLHGVVPWWNPYEGLGAPLAAGMQSAALFPPTLLLALPDGQLLFHVTLEITAGLATWFLVRELGCSRSIATLGGVLFALDGTLAWFGNAPANPVAFLPLVLLGLERLWRRQELDHAGVVIVAAGVALSIYAGFPETAYLDGLCIAAWFAYRLACRREGGRSRFGLGAGLGAVSGVALAAPLLLAFTSYLRDADVGPHAGTLATLHEHAASLPMIGLPYLYGPIAAFAGSDPTHELGSYWGDAGGYVTAGVLAMAVVGLVAGRAEDRGLRFLLGGVAGVLTLWIFGVPPFQAVLSHGVPGASDVMVDRYAMPVVELACVLLACLGAGAVAAGGERARRAAVAGGAAALAVVAGSLLAAHHTVQLVEGRAPAYRRYAVAMLIWVFVVVAVLTVATAVAAAAPAGGRRRRLAGGVAGAVLALDAMAMFAVPQLSAPRSVAVDTAPVTYLRANLRTGRLFSLWVYHADYGGYFQLAALDSDDLPVPKSWAAYVHANLAPDADATIFDGRRVAAGGPDASADLLAHLAAYEAVGVRYVVAQAALRPFGPGPAYEEGVRAVWSDRFVTIWALPSPAPPVIASGGPCRLEGGATGAGGGTTVEADCVAPATLVRSELDLAGWTATVDGRAVPVSPAAGGLQSVALPAGEHEVVFSYAPPQLRLGEGLGGAGLLAVLLGPPGARRVRRRRSASTGVPARSSRRRSP
jgi:hypothetical protein